MIKKIDKLFNKIIERLNFIKNAKISSFDQPIEAKIYSKYSNSMNIANDEIYLIFLNDILDNQDILMFNIEICEYRLNKCEVENISLNQLNFLLEQDLYNITLASLLEKLMFKFLFSSLKFTFTLSE